MYMVYMLDISHFKTLLVSCCAQRVIHFPNGLSSQYVNQIFVQIKCRMCLVLLPLGARLSMSPACREISSSDAAVKSYSARATTWSSSPLAQLVATNTNIQTQILIFRDVQRTNTFEGEKTKAAWQPRVSVKDTRDRVVSFVTLIRFIIYFIDAMKTMQCYFIID